ncbi:MAG: DMT family transporter [bacterium]
MILSTRIKAILVLIVLGTISGTSPLFIKVALKEYNTYQILFIRFGIASLLITPLLVKYMKTINLKRLIYILPAGLLFCGNVFFFVFGVQYTTSIVSQLFYILAPVLVSLLGYFLFREKISLHRIISMIICFGGSSFLILRSIQGSDLIRSIGTFHGNILILCAVISWSSYIVYTKRISKQFDPSFFLIINFISAFLISSVCLFLTKTSIIVTIVHFSQSSPSVMFSLLVLATINSVVFFFLNQWSIKHVSAFVVSSVAYISPLSAALFAIPFFGEQLSMTLLVSALCIGIGSYLILSEKK